MNQQRAPGPARPLAVRKAEFLPSAPAATVEEFGTMLATLKDKCHLVTPLASVDQILPLHQVSLRAVFVDPTIPDGKTTGPDCYRDGRFCKGDEVAMGKNALGKIMRAGGVQIEETVRVDDEKDPLFCRWRVSIVGRDFDGGLQRVQATKEIDLRPGAPDTMKAEKIKRHGQWEKTGKQIPLSASALAEKQVNMGGNAETKALNRALRGYFNLPTVMSAKALRDKPFVVPKLVAALDPNDPEQKAALIELAVTGDAALYGSRRRLEAIPVAPPPGEGVIPEGATPEGSTPEEPQAPAEVADDLEKAPQIPPKAEPSILVCPCPCGHQMEITQHRHDRTTELVGSPRCPECYPGIHFNLKGHQELQDLQIKGLPGMTPTQAEEERQRALKERAEGGANA